MTLTIIERIIYIGTCYILPCNPVYIFRPDNPEPAYHHPSVTTNHKVCGAIFIPHTDKSHRTDAHDELRWQDDEQLYYMSSTHKLLTLDVKEEVEDSPLDRTGVSD